jgi:hypothetical protein
VKATGGPGRATPGRPVLTLVPPLPEPDHRHGTGWRWLRVREAAGTVRWHILSTVAAIVSTAVPRVRGQAWAEGFTVALGARERRTWRDYADSWRQGNELAHEIVARTVGQRWNGDHFAVRRPLLVPDPAALSDIAGHVAAEQLKYSGAERARTAAEQARYASASTGGSWREMRRIMAALAVMATAAVAASDHRVTALAPAVAGRRIVVADGRHVLTPGRPGRRRPNRSRPRGRHRRTGWRTLAGRWFWLARADHPGPLRAAA